MLDIVVILAVLATLLVVVAVSQPVAVRLHLAPVVLLAVIGVGDRRRLDHSLAHVALRPRSTTSPRCSPTCRLSSETFVYVFLPLLVFEGAITSDVRRMLEDAAPILMLAVVATVVTTAVVGVALWPVSGLPLVVCLLLGSVVATTDPAAVIAVFRDVGAPARLTRLVEGESLLNDAAAIVMFVVLLGDDRLRTPARYRRRRSRNSWSPSSAGRSSAWWRAGVLLQLIPWTRDDRLAEATLTVALPIWSSSAPSTSFMFRAWSRCSAPG